MLTISGLLTGKFTRGETPAPGSSRLNRLGGGEQAGSFQPIASESLRVCRQGAVLAAHGRHEEDCQ